jgi:hypothetical protein
MTISAQHTLIFILRVKVREFRIRLDCIVVKEKAQGRQSKSH